VDLARIRRDYPGLVLVGNVDVAVLSGDDLAAVRAEVERCMGQGASGTGYMIATCNSIFSGMRYESVAELFRCEAELGACLG
jgi:uroporphyrinogen-III decarboxylase